MKKRQICGVFCENSVVTIARVGRGPETKTCKVYKNVTFSSFRRLQMLAHRALARGRFFLRLWPNGWGMYSHGAYRSEEVRWRR